MSVVSPKHLVVIPSYNPGTVVRQVVESVCEHAAPVWVVIDGSDDDSVQILGELEHAYANLRLLQLARNEGKGAAVLHAAKKAAKTGYTHILVFDSDGQHPPLRIPAFLSTSLEHPDAMVLGKPTFGKDAPLERVLWRKMANFWSAIVTLGGGIGDSLFGMRIYPIEPLLAVMDGHAGGRRFDFEPEAAIRLSWQGLPSINLATPVKYLGREEGGVSHFHYARDNWLLARMYVRLFGRFLLAFPKLLHRRLKGRHREIRQNSLRA